MKIMTRINGELCERVNDAGSLKAMDIIYGGPCCRCRCMHRGMLVKDCSGTFFGPPGSYPTIIWELQPQPPCATPTLRIYVDDRDVAVGGVWRVVDEAAIDDAIRATETKLRQRELVTV